MTSKQSSPCCATRSSVSRSSSTTTAARSVRVHLTTLGCPKNQVDSELMLGLLTTAGFATTDRAEDADCLIVNTCAFI
ncbi:MAG: hypothetical protein ACREKS_17640, partial [Candidatus Rokuibacteriota bacterium]